MKTVSHSRLSASTRRRLRDKNPGVFVKTPNRCPERQHCDHDRRAWNKREQWLDAREAETTRGMGTEGAAQW